MALILLKEYAIKHGRNPMTVAQKAERGGFHTARKIGMQWFIEDDEPYTDNRISSGKYVGKARNRKPTKPAAPEE